MTRTSRDRARGAKAMKLLEKAQEYERLARSSKNRRKDFDKYMRLATECRALARALTADKGA